MTQNEEFDGNLPDNFGYTHRSLVLLSMTLVEIKAISRPRRKREELDVLNNFLFKRFNVTLMYTFIMEYCKLLEKGKGSGNYASLHKLNKKVLALKGAAYQLNYELTEERIDKLINSDFHKLIRTLRDKVFAHSDKTENGSSLNVPSFTEKQQKDALVQFREMTSIHGVCAYQFKVEYINALDDDSSEMFIERAGKYLKYYKDHRKDDWNVD